MHDVLHGAVTLFTAKELLAEESATDNTRYKCSEHSDHMIIESEQLGFIDNVSEDSQTPLDIDNSSDDWNELE